MTLPTLDDVRAAATTIGDVAIRTPAVPIAALGGLTLKLETLQPVGAFKVRGAGAALAQLSAEQRRRGVVTASSGNHGQAVAYTGMRRGIPVTVVVPEDIPTPKAEGIASYGARMVRVGRAAPERMARAAEIARDEGLALIPSYDDRWVIAGQGTAGLEIAEQAPECAAVFAPIGGGGLVSGVGLVLKALRPEVRVIGVEAAGADRFHRSLAAGEPTTLDRADTIADGMRILTPGRFTWELVRRHVDAVVTVTDEEILDAMRVLATRARIVAEPSGAASVAAALRAGASRAVAIVSGGNVEPALLARVLAT